MCPTHGTVITTDDQTIGRGQIGRFWNSEPGANIAISIVLRPAMRAQEQFILSVVAALALYDVIANHIKLEVMIKWPNDIYVGNGKIAGILIQNTLAGSSIQSSVIGIGVNVNQTDWPNALPNPVSIKSITGKSVHRATLTSQICQQLQSYWEEVEQKSHQLLIEEYVKRLYGRGETALFRVHETSKLLNGIIDGVDGTGKLRLIVDNKEMYFALHEIRQVIQ